MKWCCSGFREWICEVCEEGRERKDARKGFAVSLVVITCAARCLGIVAYALALAGISIFIKTTYTTVCP